MLSPKIREMEDGRLVADHAARLDKTGRALVRCREKARSAVTAAWETVFDEAMAPEILAELDDALEVAQQKDARALLEPKDQDKRGANHTAECGEEWVTAIWIQKDPEAKQRSLGRLTRATDSPPESLETLKVLLHGEQ